MERLCVPSDVSVDIFGEMRPSGSDLKHKHRQKHTHKLFSTPFFPPTRPFIPAAGFPKGGEIAFWINPDRATTQVRWSAAYGLSDLQQIRCSIRNREQLFAVTSRAIFEESWLCRRTLEGKLTPCLMRQHNKSKADPPRQRTASRVWCCKKRSLKQRDYIM